ncbi:MAG: methyltransferase domain-containing protein, partial [Planctomycetota bacterium]
MKLLNVGCGKCIHSAWTNIDLVASTPEVQAHDLRRGLPFDHETFDGVYHSHVLEHLTPDRAEALLVECHRVLREGGVLRVVVPDLEGIAAGYLQTLHNAVEDPDATSLAKHRWMTLELIDQMSRQSSGGLMGQTMREPGATPPEFIRARMGHQVEGNVRIKDRKTIG